MFLGVENVASEFLLLMMSYEGSNEGILYLAKIDDTEASKVSAWYTLDLGVITDGDDFAVRFVTSQDSFIYFAGFTEGYAGTVRDIVLPNKMGFVTRINADTSSGSVDNW